MVRARKSRGPGFAALTGCAFARSFDRKAGRKDPCVVNTIVIRVVSRGNRGIGGHAMRAAIKCSSREAARSVSGSWG